MFPDGGPAPTGESSVLFVEDTIADRSSTKYELRDRDQPPGMGGVSGILLHRRVQMVQGT